MGLQTYNRLRDFKKTKEPRGVAERSGTELIFVVQEHHASHLHYDFRLEYEGVLKSWAVPKGPSTQIGEKRLAVEVEDHPIPYAQFHGDIPEGEYGAGHVEIWDEGTWEPVGDPAHGLKKGHLDFILHGARLSGMWTLVRTQMRSRKPGWLLIKRSDTREKKSAGRKPAPLGELAPLKPKATPPPKFVEPQLALLVDEVPTSDEWFHEIKLDGYRTLCRIHKSKIQFLTRKGLDWTDKYKFLLPFVKKLETKNALIDGEIVWVDDRGHSSFAGLQEALSEGKTSRLIYYVFDVLHLDGHDLRGLPLEERKARLRKVIPTTPDFKIRFSEHVEDGGEEIFKAACGEQLEGLISKQRSAPYRGGRGGEWVKSKCVLRQEFVIGGYTRSPAENRGLGALLIGYYDKNKKLMYAGRVGTGFTEKTLARLQKKFKPLERRTSPFSDHKRDQESVCWLKPELVAEVTFRTWTRDGIVRQASFEGLREDKPTREIGMEKKQKKAPKPKAAPKAVSAKKGTAPLVEVSHPDRIVYPSTKTKKIDLFNYYEAVYPLMAPFLRDRPISLLRCQESAVGECFFQKHGDRRGLNADTRPVYYKDKKDSALFADDAESFLRFVQMGAIEFHGWGARFEKITKPDLVVFDLDPESPQLWKTVVETAFEIREMLKALKLESFVKVTGGKGLHVQVPLQPKHEWDDIKNFSKSLMQVLVDREPDLYTVNSSKAERGGRIFLDYLRNGYGATAVLPYSVRARAKPTVALPISWRDLKAGVTADEFQITDVLKKLKRADPWKGYWDLKQKIAVLDKKR